MPRIPLDLVKELRRRTGASVVECRRALEATEGDLRRAAALLKLQAWTLASRRPALSGLNGVVAAHALEDGSVGSLVEVSFETRRGARSERFRQFVMSLAEQVAREPVTSLDELLESALRGRPGRVLDELGDLILRSGEAFGVRRFLRLVARPPGVVAAYAHGPGSLGRLGAMVEVSGSPGQVARRLAREVTLQVIFHRPSYLVESDVPPSRLGFELDAIRRRIQGEGAREQLSESLLRQLMHRKFCQATVLMEQPWVKDASLTIRDLVEQASKEAGAELQVSRFLLLEVGSPPEEASVES